MTLIDEPEILNGSRAWAKTQDIFASTADPTRSRYDVQVSWYDTSVSPFEGAFCMVQIGSPLEELVGDVVRVTYLDRVAWVYCVGGAELPTDFALARTAMFRMGVDLAEDQTLMAVQAAV